MFMQLGSREVGKVVMFEPHMVTWKLEARLKPE